MNPEKASRKSLTREGLKEILRVNFEVYKDEPDFYDYITTLVIYLMEFEYQKEPETSIERRAQAAGRQEAGSPSAPTNATKYKTRDGCCPHCNNHVPPDRKICPFCLAMIE